MRYCIIFGMILQVYLGGAGVFKKAGKGDSLEGTPSCLVLGQFLDWVCKRYYIHKMSSFLIFFSHLYSFNLML